jgi:hypothetical protein
MLTVNAYAAISPTEPLVPTTITRRDVGPDDVLVEIASRSSSSTRRPSTTPGNRVLRSDVRYRFVIDTTSLRDGG